MRHSIQLSLLAAVAITSACGCGSPEKVDGGTKVYVMDDPSQGEVRGRSFLDASEEGAWTSAPSTAEVIEGSLAAPGGDTAGSMEVGAINPNLAKELRADPGQAAAGAIDGLVTFGDLSLVSVDLDALLDYLYKPETELARAFEFPGPVQAKAGDEKAMVGYMIPLEYKPKSDDITIFMLVRDLMSCCFGGMPRPDEWVYVEMRGDAVARLFPYVPVVVRGELIVGRLEDDFGFATGVYTMKADAVEAFEAPAKTETTTERDG
ncbi:MAG: DUF3299 domain-containing protein [Planctomycetota bacterium]